MRTAKLYRYALPMDSGVILRDNRLKEREGFVVELSDGGRIGRGEIAPLPGFSTETMDEAYTQIVEQLISWQQGNQPDYELLAPSVAFGLSMALLELEGGLPQEGSIALLHFAVGTLTNYCQN